MYPIALSFPSFVPPPFTPLKKPDLSKNRSIPVVQRVIHLLRLPFGPALPQAGGRRMDPHGLETRNASRSLVEGP